MSGRIVGGWGGWFSLSRLLTDYLLDDDDDDTVEENERMRSSGCQRGRGT